MYNGEGRIIILCGHSSHAQKQQQRSSHRGYCTPMWHRQTYRKNTCVYAGELGGGLRTSFEETKKLVRVPGQLRKGGDDILIGVNDRVEGNGSGVELLVFEIRILVRLCVGAV